MLKKTFAAVITAAVLLGSGAAMAQTDPNWAFTKEAVEVFKNKAGYTVVKSIELKDPATGIWKVEGVKQINGVAVEYESTWDSQGNKLSEKQD